MGGRSAVVVLLLALVAAVVPVAAAEPVSAAELGTCTISGQTVAVSDAGVTQAECDALVAVYNSNGGPFWTSHNGWDTIATASPTDPCTWAGVVCDNGITKIDLYNNELSGEIPAEIGNLTNLIDLNLNHNNLSGVIPGEIGNLTNLDDLRLSGNMLSGQIPAGISLLTNLTWLDLSGKRLSGEMGNRLSGEIPTEIGNLTNLTWLELSGNMLSGEIPAVIGNLTNLTWLELSGNMLSGEIPAVIGNLTTLRYLFLNDNMLSGVIPGEIGNLTNLWHLDLTDNMLSGEIPAEIGNLTNLRGLWLYNNELSGEIPAEIGNLTDLSHLDLTDNMLSGVIPAAIGNLTKLVRLDLGGNMLSGEIPAEVGLTNLWMLGLADNMLSGEIPAAIGNLTRLQGLDLGGNLLSGGIPVEVGNLTNLWKLGLGGNMLSGEIPAAIGNLTNLLGMNLSGNMLSGGIPVEIGSLTDLELLDLSSNGLSGEIPSEIGNLTRLQGLDLYDNKLSGVIPAGIVNLPYLSYFGLKLFGNGCLSGDEATVAFVLGFAGNEGVFDCELGGGYVALNPARILDTRNSVEGDFSSPWGPGVTRAVQVTGVGGVPVSGVDAVVLHVTTVSPSAEFSWLTVSPTGEVAGVTAVHNFGTAAFTAEIVNDVIVAKVGVGGTIDIRNEAGTVELVIDVVGYYSSDAGFGYVPLNPARILDTRNSTEGDFSMPWEPGLTRAVQVTGVGGVPASGVEAVVVNVTTVSPSAGFSWLTVSPTGETPASTAAHNFGTGSFTTEIVNDLIVAKVGAGGTIDIRNHAGTVDLVVDVVGYYSSAGGFSYVAQNPTRILDTRNATEGDFSTPWAGGESRTVETTFGACADAVVLHVTTVSPSAGFSWLTITPAGEAASTTAAHNFGTDANTTQIRNDIVIAKTGVGGDIDIFNQHGNVDLVIDLVGAYGTDDCP